MQYLELSVAYVTGIFGHCSCCINIGKDSYPEETELDINPRVTLTRTLTLSTGERNFTHFPSGRC